MSRTWRELCAEWKSEAKKADKRIAELEAMCDQLASDKDRATAYNCFLLGKLERLEKENERLLDICKVTRIMLRGVLRERDFGWCMGEVTEIVKRLDAVVLGQRTALESSDE